MKLGKLKLLLRLPFVVIFMFIIIFNAVIFSFTITGGPSDDTMVSISPESQLVGPGQSFTVEVYCDPSQPIRGYELEISFDSSLIKAVSVSEGDIFSEFNTFFNSGTIYNSAGKIVDMYGLILGPGNVSEPGTFVEISFTSKSKTGTSDLTLENVGVTNETQYISISLNDGSVQVDASSPEISDVIALPASQESYGFVNISATVTDNIEVESVHLNIYYPDDSFENLSITASKIGNTYFCNRTYNMAGEYSYYIWAKDGADNDVTSSTNTFFIGDTTPPEISNVLFSSSEPLDTDSDFGWVNITCDVTDNMEVDAVYLFISSQGGSYNSLLFTSGSSDSYYYNSSTLFSQPGNYSYYILAYDVANNMDVTSTFDFSMPPNWDINKDGVANVFDLVLVSNLLNEIGNTGWIREDVDNNGEIEVLDLSIVSLYYGESWWD